MILPVLGFRSRCLAHSAAVAVAPLLAALAMGCDGLGGLDPLGGGGGPCSEGGIQLPPASAESQIDQIVCQKLEACFPNEFLASTANGQCEFLDDFHSCPETSQEDDQCITDLKNAPCPVCLAPLTQNGSERVSTATVFEPPSCQAWASLSFVDLVTLDAGCATESPPPPASEAGTPDGDEQAAAADASVPDADDDGSPEAGTVDATVKDAPTTD
jgi:hypothetical protein